MKFSAFESQALSVIQIGEDNNIKMVCLAMMFSQDL